MPNYEVTCDVRTFGKSGRLFPEQVREVKAKSDWDAVSQLREIMANELDGPTDSFGINIRRVKAIEGAKRA